MIRKYFKRFLKKPEIPIVENPNYLGYNSGEFTNVQIKYKKYDIGDFTYGSPIIYDLENCNDIASRPTKLKIGKFCSIGPNVSFFLGCEHRVDWITTYPFNALSDRFRYIKGHPYTKGDIVIENDVWFGANVTVLSGVKIGNGAVIGANSLITKDVESYSIMAGNPAAMVRKRFDKETIEFLEKTNWWNLDIEEIERLVPLLQSNNIKEFKKQTELKFN